MGAVCVFVEHDLWYLPIIMATYTFMNELQAQLSDCPAQHFEEPGSAVPI